MDREGLGVPPEQVVGSSIKTKFEMRDGKPDAVPLPEVELHRRQGRQAGRHQRDIGRRPITAFGNSDGDSKCCNGRRSGRARFGLIVHHTDAEREYAYDRNTPFGRLDKALDAAPRTTGRSWT